MHETNRNECNIDKVRFHSARFDITNFDCRFNNSIDPIMQAHKLESIQSSTTQHSLDGSNKTTKLTFGLGRGGGLTG